MAAVQEGHSTSLPILYMCLCICVKVFVCVEDACVCNEANQVAYGKQRKGEIALAVL